MVPAGPAKLDPAERRKLIKEIRDEVRPLISQIADFQIEKAVQMIKVQIRKVETERVVEDQRLNDKIDREVKRAEQKAEDELKLIGQDLNTQIRAFQRQRARDKSDVDMKFAELLQSSAGHGKKLEEHGVNFEAIAIVNSMLIENLNMQLEGESADLIDRRMMSLFGMQGGDPTKLDVQNTSNLLKDVGSVMVNPNKNLLGTRRQQLGEMGRSLSPLMESHMQEGQMA